MDDGNPAVAKDWGLDEVGIDDERFTTTSYALGGNALSLWVIDRPLMTEVTDESGKFVSRKVNYYDGEPFTGLKGVIESRALLHRTEEFITDSQSVSATRSKFDAFGNIVESRDPNGNVRRVAGTRCSRRIRCARKSSSGMACPISSPARAMTLDSGW